MNEIYQGEKYFFDSSKFFRYREYNCTNKAQFWKFLDFN